MEDMDSAMLSLDEALAMLQGGAVPPEEDDQDEDEADKAEEAAFRTILAHHGFAMRGDTLTPTGSGLQYVGGATKADEALQAAQDAIKHTTGVLGAPAKIVGAVGNAQKGSAAAAAALEAASSARIVGPAAAAAARVAAPIAQGIAAGTRAAAPVLQGLATAAEFAAPAMRVLGPVGLAVSAGMYGYNVIKGVQSGHQLKQYDRDIQDTKATDENLRQVAMYLARDPDSSMERLDRQRLLIWMQQHDMDTSPVHQPDQPKSHGKSVPEALKAAFTGDIGIREREFLEAKQRADAGVPKLLLKMQRNHKLKRVNALTTDRITQLFPGITVYADPHRGAMKDSSAYMARFDPPAQLGSGMDSGMDSGIGGGMANDGASATVGVGKALTGEEVTSLTHIPGIKTYRYPDLKQVADWKTLMGSAGAALILFLTDSPTNGHWICAFDGPDGAHFFDPIGIALDGERFHISEEMRDKLDQNEPQLRRIMRTSGKPILVSKHEFQDDSPGINTCGRWVALRLQHKDQTDKDFAAWVRAQIKESGKSSDEWIAAATRQEVGGSLSGSGTGAGAGFMDGLASMIPGYRSPMDAVRQAEGGPSPYGNKLQTGIAIANPFLKTLGGVSNPVAATALAASKVLEAVSEYDKIKQKQKTGGAMGLGLDVDPEPEEGAEPEFKPLSPQAYIAQAAQASRAQQHSAFMGELYKDREHEAWY